MNNDYINFINNILHTGSIDNNGNELLEYNGIQFWSNNIDEYYKKFIMKG